MSVNIDNSNFQAQVKRIFSSWEENPKNPRKIVTFVSSCAKMKYLKKITLTDRRIELKFAEKGKFTDWMELIKKCGGLGMIQEDERYQFGEYIKSFFSELRDLVHENGLKNRNISFAIRKLQSVKYPHEISIMKKSSKYTTIVLSKYVRKEIERILVKNDSKSNISHRYLSDYTEKGIEDPSRMGLNKLSFSDVSVFEPILIGSGEEAFDLSSTETDPNIMFSSSTINVYMGTYYKLYGSVVARTYMVNPSKFQKADYLFLYNLYKFAASKCLPGEKMSTVYDSVKNRVRSGQPELEQYFFSEDIGFCVGIENRPEKTFLICPHNEHKFEVNMVIVLRLAFQNVPEQDPIYMSTRGKYSLIIANTLLIEQTNPKYLTGGDVQFENVSYILEDEEEEEKEAKIKWNIPDEIISGDETEQERRYNLRRKRRTCFRPIRHKYLIEEKSTPPKEKSLLHEEKVVLDSKLKNPVLENVFIKTTANELEEYDKVKGNLESKGNSFVFTEHRIEKTSLEVDYQNIRFAFFQPCNSLLEDHRCAILHFYLLSSRKLFEKKNETPRKHVQFFVSCCGDDDEEEEEGESDSMKDIERNINDRFESFCVAVGERRKDLILKFQKTTLGFVFYGVVNNVNLCLLTPTESFSGNNSDEEKKKSLYCLVNLENEFVLPLEDLEIAVFERILSKDETRTCDVAMVYKDYSRVELIRMIERVDMGEIQGWMDRNNLIFFEFSLSLVWKEILSLLRKFASDWKPWDVESGWMSIFGPEDTTVEDDIIKDGDDLYVPTKY